MATNMTTPSYFPIDVLIIILSFLPSKYLLRFRCVCKFWRDLINDPKFIEFHRNQNKNDHILTIYRSNEAPGSALYLRCDKTFMERTRLELPFLKFYEPLWLRDLSVAGCSNGLVLICLYGVQRTFMNIQTFKIHHEKPLDTEIILWNPSSQKWKVLPYSECLSNSHILTFGFVPRVNDYKVVSITNYITSCLDDRNYFAKAEIYSLSTNSWKPVENVVGCGFIKQEFKQVVNGVVILLAYDNDPNYAYIICFDMADEVFTKTRIPQLNGFTLYPMMYGEELLLFGTCCDQRTSAAYIWAMKENYDGAAAEDSLTELFTSDKHVQPLGFLKNGELVWRYKVREGNMHGSLGLYDPILRQVKDVDTDFPWMVYALSHYRESLILLNEGD